jgi:hypothetical protein
MISKLATFVAAAVFATSTVANASTLDFEIDLAGSSVAISDSSNGFLCNLTNCGIDAQLNSGLDGLSFTLGEGESNTFDFIDWDLNGLGNGSYNVEATLAFSSPISGSVTGTGGGAFLTFFGILSAQTLNWTGLPSILTLADGSIFSVDFEGGSNIFFGGLTTSATVTADRVAAVPLPGGLVLLLAGLGGLALVGRRRSQAVA